MTGRQLPAPVGQRRYALAPPPPRAHYQPLTMTAAGPPTGPIVSLPAGSTSADEQERAGAAGAEATPTVAPVAEHSGVIGALWPPPSDYGPPPALMQWRSRRRPLWAWSPRTVGLTVAATGSVLGVLVLLVV